MNILIPKKIFQLSYKVYTVIFPEPIMNFIVWKVRIFVRSIPEQLKPGSRILDAGAGDLQYKKYFTNFNYVSQDVTPYPSLDIVSSISSIPEPDSSFDAIMTIQVLEHLKDPMAAFKELSRLLKVGGRLYLSTHLIFPVHMEPYDYFRFTPYSLKMLAEENNLNVVSIRPHGGIFMVISKLVQIAIPKLFNDHPVAYYSFHIIFAPITFLICLFCFILDHLDRYKTVTLNYECIFEKNPKDQITS